MKIILCATLAALMLSGCASVRAGLDGVLGDRPIVFTYNPNTKTLDGSIPVSIPVGNTVAGQTITVAPASANPQLDK